MKTVGVVGVGRLGLCYALLLAKKDIEVIGIDNNSTYIEKLNSKEFQSNEPDVNKLVKTVKNITFSDDINDLAKKKLDAVFLFVPTPTDEIKGYDHSILDAVFDNLLKINFQNTPLPLIVGATTLPGYCSEIEKKISKKGFNLIYSPQFIAQGQIIKDLTKPDTILIGSSTDNIGNAILPLLALICTNEPTVQIMSLISAEITKLATNCFLTMKIAFANSIGDLATLAGGEPDKILNAIGQDKRIGNRYLKYGFGFGGPCFPRDNRALNKFSDTFGLDLKLSKATDEANLSHTEFQVTDYLTKTPEHEAIVFNKITYKDDSDILEESQKLKIAILLAKRGVKIIIKERPSIVKALEKMYPNTFSFSHLDE